MWPRRKDLKNQFIGRRTGKNILPGKELRKREDGTDVFDDYWTDSDEGDDIISALLGKPEAGPPPEEHVEGGKNEKGDMSYKTVVTDVIESEMKVIYDNDEYAIEHTKSVNQTITIERSDQQHDDDDDDDESSERSPRKLNETHTILDKANQDVFQDKKRTPSLNVTFNNSLNLNNLSPVQSIHSVSPKRKSLTFNKKDTSHLELNLVNEEDFEVNEPNIGDSNSHNLDSGIKSLGKASSSSDSNDMVCNSDSKENEEAMSLEENDKIAKKKVKKTQKRKKTNRSMEHHSHTKDSAREENFPDSSGLRSVLVENANIESHLSDVLSRQQLDNDEDHSPKRLKVSENCDNDVSRSSSPQKKKKDKKIRQKGKSKSRKEVNNKDNSVIAAEDNQGPRKSSRQRHAPLKFWSNERLQYRYTETGEIECLGVVRDSKGDQLIYDKVPKKKKLKTSVETKRIQPVGRPARSFVEKGILVFDPESHEEVYANVVIPYDDIKWRSPQASTKVKTYEIGKSYIMDHAAFGFLRVEPMQTKPLQYLPGYDAVFVIMKGKVEVCVNNTTMLLSEKDTFFVPMGNLYSVANLLDTEALLNFMATNNSYLDELKKTE